MRRTLAFGLVPLCALFAGAASAPPASAGERDWVLHERDESPSRGYSVYRRQQPGEDFSTWRLETRLAEPPELVESVTLANLLEGRRVPADRRQRLLRREGDVFWVHTEIDVPVAADRDVVLRIERRRDPATRALRIEWRAEPSAGPAPAEGVVRMEISNGFWHFEPAPGGGTRAIYESYAEPGGPFPKWLVDSMSSGQVREGLEQLRGSLAEAADELPPVASKSVGG